MAGSIFGWQRRYKGDIFNPLTNGVPCILTALIIAILLASYAFASPRCDTCPRDKHGHIQHHASARAKFKRLHPIPATRSVAALATNQSSPAPSQWYRTERRRHKATLGSHVVTRWFPSVAAAEWPCLHPR